MRFLILLILSGCATQEVGISDEACQQYIKEMTLAGTLRGYRFGTEFVGPTCENAIFSAQQNLPEE